MIHKENPESAPVSILRVGSGHANKKLKDLPLQESVVKLQQFIKDSRRRWLYHCPRQYSASVSLLPDVQLQSKAIIPRPTLSAHREQQIMIFCNQKNKQTLRGDWRQTGGAQVTGFPVCWQRAVEPTQGTICTSPDTTPLSV